MTSPTHVAGSPLPVIEEAFRALARAFSAVQLYLPNNQQRVQRLVDVRHALAQVWRHDAELTIEVRETSFQVDGATVFQDPDRGADGLPWLLYRDGIRGLTFTPGFENEEVEVLLSLLHAMRAAAKEEDDLVTRLWVTGFRHLTYRYLDAFDGEPMTGGADAGGDAGVFSLYVPESEVVDVPDAGPTPFIDLEAFESALYFLSTGEAEILHADLTQEYAEDPRRMVVDALIDLLEVGLPPEAQEEARNALDTLIVELLVAGDYELVAHILGEANRIAQRRQADPALAAALGTLPDRLSEPRAMAQLLLAIDDSTNAPATALLDVLFQQLRPGALEALARWLGTAGASPARTGIKRASRRLATTHASELARLLEHEDPVVVNGALRVAVDVPSPALVPGLARVLRGEDVPMRLDAVAALANIGSPGSMQTLERSLDDSDRDVRVAIYRAISSRKYTAALHRLLQIVRSRDTRAADMTEKLALFEAFGSLCGDAGIAELDGLLNSRGLLGAKEPPELRACAARALGLIGTPAAMAALQRASDTKEIVVRSAVLRALREGT